MLVLEAFPIPRCYTAYVAICLQTFGTAYRFHIQESKQSEDPNYTGAEPKSLKIIIPHPVKKLSAFYNIGSSTKSHHLSTLWFKNSPHPPIQIRNLKIVSFVGTSPKKTLSSCVLHVLNISSSLIGSLQYMTSSTNHEAFCYCLPPRFIRSPSTPPYSSNHSLNSSLNAPDQV